MWALNQNLGKAKFYCSSSNRNKFVGRRSKLSRYQVYSRLQLLRLAVLQIIVRILLRLSWATRFSRNLCIRFPIKMYEWLNHEMISSSDFADLWNGRKHETLVVSITTTNGNYTICDFQRFYKKAAAFVLRAVAKHSPQLAQVQLFYRPFARHCSENFCHSNRKKEGLITHLMWK
jgi:hypothetical protein